MSHKFIDISAIPKKINPKNEELVKAIFKVVEVISQGKAVLLDLEKLERKRTTVISATRKLIGAGELPGIELVVRAGEIYLVRK